MYSTTQTTNYVALAGLLVLILKYFGVVVPNEEMLTIVAGTAMLVSLIVSIYNRYKKGDITIAGRYR